MNYSVEEIRELSGNCYFLEDGVYNDVLQRKNEPSFILYPERGRNIRFLSTEFLPPANKDVVTENPWVVSSYDKKKVFILKEGQWVNPDFQTFGCSVNVLMTELFNLDNSIPKLPLFYLKQLLC